MLGSGMTGIDHARRRTVMARSIALGHCICDPRTACPCPTLKEENRCPCAGEVPPPRSGPVRLTASVKAAGCGAKIPKAQLAALLAGLPAIADARVLVGSASGDDAAVVRLGGADRDLVQTVDVLAPPVDDPRTYGRIAAANALSDVWAMGGRAECAMSVIGWPTGDLPAEALAEVLRGGAEVMVEAGVPVVGGQSVTAAEPFAGYSVTGTVEPGRAVRNHGARPGDVLVLSKALGGGFLGFAQQIGRLDPAHLAAWSVQMTALNRTAGEAMARHGATAGTDITGFGLVGHLIAIAERGPCTLVLDVDALPVHPGARELARQEVWPGALERNREAVAPAMLDLRGLAPAQEALLFCPETSGGICACLPPDRVAAYRADCAAAGTVTAVIGRVEAGPALIRAATARAADWAPIRVSVASTLAAADPSPGCCAAPAPSCCPAPPPEPPPAAAQAAAPVGGLPPSAASDAFAAYMKAVTAPGALDGRTKKLIALALSVADRCGPCVDINAAAARQAGADDAQLAEAVALGIAFGGAPTAMFYNRLRSHGGGA